MLHRARGGPSGDTNGYGSDEAQNMAPLARATGDYAGRQESPSNLDNYAVLPTRLIPSSYTTNH